MILWSGCYRNKHCKIGIARVAGSAGASLAGEIYFWPNIARKDAD